SLENFRVSELLRTQGLDRIPVESAGPGDIVAVAGVNDIMIGETIVDPNDPNAGAGGFSGAGFGDMGDVFSTFFGSAFGG
ncbi:hypothetical protein QP286_26940, partial [Escherichia coli]|nr:hypothetical protein [Escherichia coli]